jgi:hypothetical protein
MAQIMKYWKHPTQRTVNIPAYPTESLDIPIPAITGTTTYDWTNMQSTTAEYKNTTQENAVAKLMYECGVALEMDYTPSVSYAYSNAVASVLPRRFAYDNRISLRNRSEYRNIADFENELRSELDAGRPIYYSGYEYIDGEYKNGHAFVCDGYKCDDGTFHFNWGWGGQGPDGYYVTSALNTADPKYRFNYLQTIVYNIKPAPDGFVYATGADGTSTFEVTASKSIGGYLIPEGSTFLYNGNNQPYTFEAHSGYEIDQVWIDGIPNATAKANGYYIFSDIAANHSIIVTFKASSTGIEVFHSQDISIYPNPTKDELFIKSESQIKKVEIYSLTGSLLLSENNFNEKISVSALPKGVYVVRIYTDKGSVVSKVVKK